MKKILFFCVLALGLAVAGRVYAQVSVQVNLGVQPIWGPAGYDRAAYYFMPDMDTYYDVNRRQFIYNAGDRWVHATVLPPRCRNYDLYNGYKVSGKLSQPVYP
jgi:hypothetical protein